MKLLLENWRKYLEEDLTDPQAKQMAAVVQKVTGRGRFGGKSREVIDVAKTNIEAGTTAYDMRRAGIDQPGVAHGVRPLHQQEFEAAIKEAWRQMARPHQSFLKKIIKIHWIGAYASEGGESNRGQLKALNGFLASRCSAGKSNKDEMSTYGYNTINDSMGVAGEIGILVDGWISLAASEDIGTEWTSLAQEKDRQRMSASGLPKRPGLGYLARDETELELQKEMFDRLYKIFMIDAQSWENPGERSGQEVIVANWSCKAIVLAPGYRDLWRDQLPALLTLGRSANLPVIDMNLKPIDNQAQMRAAEE